MIYRKYEFDSLTQANELLPDCLRVDLGNLVLSTGVYDENEVELHPPVISTKYAVDCLLTEGQAEQLSTFEVWPKEPAHFIAGWKEKYLLNLKP